MDLLYLRRMRRHTVNANENEEGVFMRAGFPDLISLSHVHLRVRLLGGTR